MYYTGVVYFMLTFETTQYKYHEITHI